MSFLLVKRANFNKGVFSEKIASKFLETHMGYSELTSRYKTKYGEIDIVMLSKNDSSIIFVEVKSRNIYTKSDYSSVESILPIKQVHRITKASDIFISDNCEYNTFSRRIDLIIISSGIVKDYIQNISFL